MAENNLQPQEPSSQAKQEGQQAPASQSRPSIPQPRPALSRAMTGAVATILVLVLAGLGGYYLAQHRKAMAPVTTQPQPVADTNPTAAPPVNQEPSGTDIPSTYKISGIVQWQDPAKVDPVTVFDPKDSNDYKYDSAYKIGTFTSGPYKGGDLLIGVTACDCMGSSVFHAVKQGSHYTLLAKYTTDGPNADTVDMTKFAVDDKYTLPDLEFPPTLKGPKPRQQLNLEHQFFAALNFFKVDKNIKPAFVDLVAGQVYMTVDKPDDTLIDNFRGNGFYFKAPDGTVVSYSLAVDFVGSDNVPQVTWADGSQNKQEYTYKDIGGCGAQNFAAVVAASDVGPADLATAGTNSQGDPVYTLKDANHPLLKDYYDNHYYVADGQKKMPYTAFVKTRPLFFWYDPFGRLIKFQNSQFLPQAECAKPVIYLYPQQREQVKVQLAPQGGFTYSDPAYNQGWNVMADPSGILTELATHKQYPYLFWEGRGGMYQTPDKGFVVAQGDVPAFVDNKLRQLGLNDKEAADFKEFWLPKMQGAPYYFVTFMDNQVMDQIAPLSITPKPDTVIRILMDFKPLSRPIPAQGYTIRTPKRQGFTVVEWGGVLH